MADNISSKPWDGSASNYKDANAYCAACLVDANEPGSDKVKALCKMPVREPSGDYNRTALGAAAAALAGARGNGVDLPPAEKKKAAKKLAALYARFQLPLPDSLKNMAR